MLHQSFKWRWLNCLENKYSWYVFLFFVCFCFSGQVNKYSLWISVNREYSPIFLLYLLFSFYPPFLSSVSSFASPQCSFFVFFHTTNVNLSWHKAKWKWNGITISCYVNLPHREVLSTMKINIQNPGFISSNL